MFYLMCAKVANFKKLKDKSFTQKLNQQKSPLYFPTKNTTGRLCS